MPDDYTKSTQNGFHMRWLHSSDDLFNSSPPNDLGGAYYKSLYDIFNGSKNPRWRDQISKVANATTIASGVKYNVGSWEIGPPVCKYLVRYDPTLRNRWQGSATGVQSDDYGGDAFLPAVVNPSDAENTLAYNRAIEKLYAKLNYFKSTARVGEDVGEARQTLNALRNPLPVVRKYMTDSEIKTNKVLKRWTTPVSLANDLANTHLEFVYGWLPLASSIAQATVALQNRDNIAFYRDFHAMGEVDFAGSTRREVSPTAIFSSILNTTRKSTRTITFQGVWAEESKVPRHSVNRVLGLTHKDILPTIWNLIPYSFLVDYFTNVGTIADSISVPWGGVKWCQQTIRTENFHTVNATYRYNTITNYTPIYFSQKPGLYKSSSVTFSRFPVYTLPLPELEFTSPRNVTGRQWLNMAALAVSQSTKLLLGLRKAVEKEPDLPKLFIQALRRRGGYRDPYPYHRKI